jgi:hypothetical protein
LGTQGASVDITTTSFELANAVILYDNLAQAQISRDAIANLFPGETPEFLDIGPIMVVRFPGHRAEIVILRDQNRAELKITSPNEADWSNVARNTFRLQAAINGTPLNLYGFNIFTFIPVPGELDARQYMVQRFITSLDPIAQELQGEVRTIIPTIKFIKNEQNYQLRLEPRADDSNLLNMRFNIEFTAAALPPEEEFVQSYVEFKDDVIATIGRLFN